MATKQGYKIATQDFRDAFLGKNTNLRNKRISYLSVPSKVLQIEVQTLHIFRIFCFGSFIQLIILKTWLGNE